VSCVISLMLVGRIEILDFARSSLVRPSSRHLANSRLKSCKKIQREVRSFCNLKSNRKEVTRDADETLFLPPAPPVCFILLPTLTFTFLWSESLLPDFFS
jgi:hypothetical protein